MRWERALSDQHFSVGDNLLSAKDEPLMDRVWPRVEHDGVLAFSALNYRPWSVIGRIVLFHSTPRRCAASVGPSILAEGSAQVVAVG